MLGAIALIFVFGFGYGRWYSTRPASAPAGRKILYYVDPMHPWYKSDKPGTAPDCGMTPRTGLCGRRAGANRAAVQCRHSRRLPKRDRWRKAPSRSAPRSSS